MKYLIDTSAWIEYLEGSVKGEKVHELLQGVKAEIYILPLILGELVSKAERKAGKGKEAYEIAMKRARLISVSTEEALEGGLLHAQKRKTEGSFSLADALICTVAKQRGAKLVTSDAHFRSFDTVIMI
jgi:predicted nucleic acid-binding protein